MAKQRRRVKKAKAAIASLPPRRVKFTYDPDGTFEECNGEGRPLTEAEYAEGVYMGCPDHPRAGSQPDPTKPGTGYWICGRPGCGKALAPIDYEEYLAYYGNPDRHVYLGAICEEQCPTCGEWHEIESLWGIDFMDDSAEYLAINSDEWRPAAEARALPGYAGDVARQLAGEGQ